ncbi:hypothetical protein HOG21_08390 [bacterium]|nr:hypothetical protein [bacterium]
MREFHLKIVKEKINDTNQSLINEVDDVFEKFENDIIYYMRSDKKIIPTEKNDYSISTNT